MLLAADRPAVLREEQGEGRPHEGDDRQFGNHAEAFRRFESGGPETYRDQRLSVDYVASLAETGTVTTIAIGDDEHDLELKERLHSIGVAWEHLDRARVSRLSTGWIRTS